MTPAEAQRPVPIVIAVLAALTLTACGGEDAQPRSFQTMAQDVADIHIPMDPPQGRQNDRPPSRDREARPHGFAPMKVALMTPHEMWDARDARLGRGEARSDERHETNGPSDQGMVAQVKNSLQRTLQSGVQDAAAQVGASAVQAQIQSQAPALMKVKHTAPAQEARAAPVARREPSEASSPVMTARTARGDGRFVQLGAFSSEAAAHQAWERMSGTSGMARLSPRYEAVGVNGKTLTRLKIGPVSADQAHTLCRLVQANDPWCLR
ncbi:hypothetical protein LTR94_025637 [Friedmanniomyces endolithicus]|nr:hypothetical protein LTR94_025637 [Friedmanniomyces endolithicus]